MSTPARRAPTTTAMAWGAMVVVLVVALVIGASPRTGTPTLAQRAAAIEANVKCPSCEGISVAQSSSSTAVAIRQVVAQQLRAGQSDGAIDAFLVSRYGEGILLRPPASGGTSTVWIVPLLAIAGAVGALGTFFWRRRRLPAAVVAEDDRAVVARARAEWKGGDG